RESSGLGRDALIRAQAFYGPDGEAERWWRCEATDPTEIVPFLDQWWRTLLKLPTLVLPLAGR
ncbi:hypothetical protein, partial [Solihabitans fulvus]|uniref:hypothetical protein n=1 Tax=Solihabitans fulvus TaxID=1892852 RepID=UPI001CB768D2